ncbi:MAG: 6-pyruvoyl trahydropterin synthase family protein [Longimicrobiaceae bacterium]
MYTICVRAHYDSAHFLRDYKGKCEKLHGHRYEAEAALEFGELGSGGMAYDFTDAKQALRAVAGELDHENLNELEVFQGVETSAENQARWIYGRLKERLGAVGEHLLYVRVWETPNQWAQYSQRH